MSGTEPTPTQRGISSERRSGLKEDLEGNDAVTSRMNGRMKNIKIFIAKNITN